jgi:hypothetical protein
MLVAITSASPALAQTGAPQPNLGGPGESCRARSDCSPGLRCVSQVCTSEHEGESCSATSDCGDLKCIDHTCTNGHAASPPGSAARPRGEGFDLEDGKVHPFGGATVAGGFSTNGVSGKNSVSGGFETFDGAFLFALNGGVFVGLHQFSLELAPLTYFYDTTAPGPVFETVASYAYFVPLSGPGKVRVFWPFRFGAGTVAGPDGHIGGLAYLQLRADFIGPAIQIEHVMLDFHFPTFRYAVTDNQATQYHFLDWLFGATVSYVF